MASYEDDHNITSTTATPPPRPRLDLTSFFSALDTAQSSGNPEAAAAAAPFRELATAFQGLESRGPEVEALVLQLLAEAESPDKRRGQEGVSQEFLDALERVPRKKLQKSDVCAICHMAFLDDPYPLVVRLGCHREHIFDMECIAPWLKLHSTCPLDRKDLLRKATPPPPDSEDEEDWEGLYG